MAANWRRTACEVKKNPRSNMESRMQRKHLALTMVFQRTVTTPLSLCLTLRVHPRTARFRDHPVTQAIMRLLLRLLLLLVLGSYLLNTHRLLPGESPWPLYPVGGRE